MNVYGYDQCTECKRLIPRYPPEAQASSCPALYTYIAGSIVCWECCEKRAKVLGVIPFPAEKPEEKP